MLKKLDFKSAVLFFPFLCYFVINLFDFIDTRTRDWLKKIIEPVFGHPQFVRFSWSTCAEMLKKQAKEVSW